MSQCIVPKWNNNNERQQRQERQVVEGDHHHHQESNNRSSHVHLHQNPSTQQLVPNMPNYEVAELTWENGQLAMHGLGGFLQPQAKPVTWGRTNETLESIVHQATTCQIQTQGHHKQTNTTHNHQQSSAVASSDGKWGETCSGQKPHLAPLLMKKRSRSESNQCARSYNGSNREEHMDLSASASASATFGRESDTTMMTWASFESPPPSNFKAKTIDDDSTSHGGSENQDEDRETKTETVRSQSSRRTRAAAIHNQSERRRRDRINQKMKALQKLVPNASKTDKASMLDEVIEYLKQLQAQIQVMSVRNMPQMMMPLGMQQQLQMSLLARTMGMGAVGLGMGMGMGMLDMGSMPHNARPAQSLPQLMHPSQAAAATPAFLPSPFMVSPMIPAPPGPSPASQDHPSAANASVPLPDPYSSFLAQSMNNMDLYNRMAAAIYGQQLSQTTQQTSTQTQSNSMQGDRMASNS